MTTATLPTREPPVAAPENPGAATVRDWARTLTGLAVVAGILLRLLEYAGDRSLWLDEALLAPKVLHHSLGQLLQPGNWAVTPPGFLILAKLATVAGGPGELALRAVPLVAGIASVFLFLAVARRYLPAGAVPIAAWIFALSPFLVYYAAEFKQYSLDVAVALGLLWYAAEIRARGVDARRMLLWTAAGFVAVFFSFTAAFVLGGVMLALLIERARARDWPAVRLLLLPCAAWGAAFGAVYLLRLRGVGHGSYMQTFWASGFMPLPPRSMADLAWFPETFKRIFRDPLGVIGDKQITGNFFQAAAAMAAFVAGCAWAWARRRTELLLLALPIVLTLLASALHAYPFGGTWISSGRVILFLAPSFFLLIAAGAWEFLGRMRAFGIALLFTLLAAPTAYALIAVPSGRTEVRPLLEYVAQQWQPGDVLYVRYQVTPAVQYYVPRLGLPADALVLAGVCARFEPGRYVDELRELQGHARVWVLFGTGTGANGFDEKGLMLGYLDHAGRKLDGVLSQGASVYLYDLSAKQVAPYEVSIRAPQPDPTSGCELFGD